MKLKFKVNLKKCDITVSSIVLSTITYKVRAYPEEGGIIDLAIVEEKYFTDFGYKIYVICYKNNDEYWAELYSFGKRRRIKELSKALKKYEDDKELERKIIKVLETYLAGKKCEKMISGSKKLNFYDVGDEMQSIFNCAMIMICAYGDEEKALKYIKKELKKLSEKI